jgi:hypothetical protein
MLLLGKIVLGMGATLAMTSAYVFHEGVIRVDVDENRPGGEHVHFWVPATTVSAGLRLARLAPQHPLDQAGRQVRPYIPLLRKLSKELEKYPNAEFVDVMDDQNHVRIATVHGRLQIDATEEESKVHVTVPLETLQDVVDRLEEAAAHSHNKDYNGDGQAHLQN